VLSNDEKLKRIKKACQLGRYDFNHMIQRCRDGEYQFWETDNGVGVTTIEISGEHRVLFILAVAGTLEGVDELRQIIDKFAVEQACDVIRTIGRMGFKASAQGFDAAYRPIGIMFEKVL